MSDNFDVNGFVADILGSQVSTYQVKRELRCEIHKEPKELFYPREFQGGCGCDFPDWPAATWGFKYFWGSACTGDNDDHDHMMIIMRMMAMVVVSMSMTTMVKVMMAMASVGRGGHIWRSCGWAFFDMCSDLHSSDDHPQIWPRLLRRWVRQP